jgi:hypothetical protein
MIAKCTEAEKNSEAAVSDINLESFIENEDLSKVSHEEVLKFINKALVLAEQTEDAENFQARLLTKNNQK